jgi:hypothetical protein
MVEARCPRGCTENVSVWSFVRADTDEALRDALLAGELNLVACPHCGDLFFPDAVVVYFDPRADLLAFVFPESYRAEEARWRGKMREDFERMRAALASEAPLEADPEIFFGMEACREVLLRQDDLEDEVRVAETLAGRLGLELGDVERAFARRGGLPWRVPLRGPGSGLEPKRIRAGIDALLASNDRLEGYRRWLDVLSASSGPVPARRRPA